jgi:hypothetical protein
MPQRKLPNYLRTYRRRACLSQDEVAYVLGCRSGSKISRYENCSRLPTPETNPAPGDFPSGKKGDVLTVEFTVMAAKRAFDAMMQMTKIDIAAIEAARRG